ncbi:hypothetical protein QBC42DRAFT_291537 [Cladorrhinum samala]|uniref:Cellobiose dehydrogenase-like cytochrome domain-containing protein n=1 Tax=Cladorrhinum samala TaxID=585594 RepID=A0AAV9HEH5_9PEZI|nr:hypothetical protein QBC42DRAFT_291537 [Cladorrhinum samala]
MLGTMKHTLAAILLLLAERGCLAQTYNEMTPSTYTHPPTNLTFSTWTDPDQIFTFGLASPPANSSAVDYTGLLRCKTPGWCGFSHGPSMLDNLLLVAYLSPTGQVQREFRFAPGADGYFEPPPYAESSMVQLEQLDATVNDDGEEFEIVYKCRGCIGNDGIKGLGYAVGLDRPVKGDEENQARLEFHVGGYGVWEL